MFDGAIDMSIQEKYSSLQNSILRHQKKRSKDVLTSECSKISPIIIGVCKRQPDSRVTEASRVGVGNFGENYLNNLISRKNLIPPAIFHLVGKVQSNKIGKALENADWIHTIYSSRNLLKFIGQLNSFFTKSTEESETSRSICRKILLQIDPSSQSGDKGFTPDSFSDALDILDNNAVVKPFIAGVMTIAPFQSSSKELRLHFSEGRKMLNLLYKSCPSAVYYSAGMSSDFDVAIEEGSNMVRLGTSLFGKRED